MIPSRSRAARFSTSPKSAAWLTNPPGSRGSPSVCPAWPAGIQLCSPSSRWTASSASRQVGRECDLPVQSRVAAGVDDLHDDIRADVDVVLRISEIPHCRSLEFPRGRAVRRAWDELTGLSSPGLLTG